MASTIPWERVRQAGSKLTTPLHPDDYLRLINPLWSQRELRGRIEKVVEGSGWKERYGKLPYGKGLGARALTAALTANWIAPEALIVWEENAPQTAPDGFDLVDTRRFGDTTLTLITAR